MVLGRCSALVVTAILASACVQHEVSGQRTIYLSGSQDAVLAAVSDFVREEGFIVADPRDDYGIEHPIVLTATREDGVDIAVEREDGRVALHFYQRRSTFNDHGNAQFDELISHMRSALPNERFD